MRELYLAYNQITSLKDFPVFPNLQILNLNENQIESFEGLPDLPNLH
ncbi:MAG: leucine-rich repeat domain-containing protein [Holosporales bacterium]|nr:leucine-rich repeat domain-containing protein [Holosporales bacterium]